MYAMAVPYIVAVLVRALAHVHLLSLHQRVAICRRQLRCFRRGTAVEIILLVFHCELYVAV